MTSARPEVRQSALLYRPGQGKQAHSQQLLYCDQVALEALGKRFGTPLYVYSARMIRERVQAFDRAFHRVPHTVCYSIKANSNLELLRQLAKLKCGFDVVSGGELERVLHVDRKLARKVVFSGVGKTREELLAALKANILLFNVESEPELELISECASIVRRRALIALRVNPDVPAETHPYIATGLHEHKFGIPVADAVRLYAHAGRSKCLEVGGVSVHIGSQITEPQPFAAAMERVAELVHRLRRDGHAIKYVDAGGGLGIDYENSSPRSFQQHVTGYATAIMRPLQGLNLHLLLEPGRSIVGPAGVLLTRVLYRKCNDGKKFLVVDAAMNDLLRPALYGAYHEVVPVRRSADPSTETVDVVGPICESGDFLARQRELPTAEAGDLLAVLDAGAYGMSLASNYNTRPRPAEVLVDGKRARVIRRRETVRDLLRLETR